tara:strand:+ start:2874 stop:3134 length:261 start_codon:yes stop_codon:yes gene_type:complete
MDEHRECADVIKHFLINKYVNGELHPAIIVTASCIAAIELCVQMTAKGTELRMDTSSSSKVLEIIQGFENEMRAVKEALIGGKDIA